MKKILLSAGVVALAASCTNELDLQNAQQEQLGSGISFTAEDAKNTASRGEYEEGDNVWYPFWTAEDDKVNVYATGVTDRTSGKVDFGDDLSDENFSVYKATRSERSAYFTASSDADILDFNTDITKDNPATFFATYPTSVKIKSSTSVKPDWKNGFEVELTLPGLTSIQTQTNTNGKGIYELNAKYAVAKGYPKANNQVAVGENVPLSFNRLLSGLVLKTKNVNKYTEGDASIFGKLKSVKVETKGEYKDGEAVKDNPKQASLLGYTNGTATITVNSDGTTEAKTTLTGNETSVTTNMLSDATGLQWSDDASAYMIVKPVSRVDNNNKAWNEGVSITYTFENIEFTILKETSNSWKAGEFYPVTLDINDYKHLVTKNGINGYDKTGLTLILNEGADFDKIVKVGESNTTVAWNWGTTNTTVDATNITRLISNIDLTDKQLQLIGDKFTALTDIELNAETSIPAGAFKNQATKLTRLILPKVTSINTDFTKNTNVQNLEALKELNLESYSFPSTTINNMLFNGMGLSTPKNIVLEKINIKGVKDMTAEFNINRTLSFEGFSALKYVEMGENVVVAQKAFKGCTSLLSVKGTLDLKTANAVYAFYCAGQIATGATKDDRFTDCVVYDSKNTAETFSTINLTSTEIPANAFAGATAMYHILKDGKQIVPTFIGEGAFNNAVSLKYLDLSKATTIGKEAFKGADEYVGVENSKRLDVNVATVEKDILAGTKVVNVYFTNATKVNGPIFTDCTALKQLEFAKNFEAATLDSDLWTKGFGETNTDVELFIKDGQKYYDKASADQKLSLPYMNGKDVNYAPVKFKSIKVRP